MDSVGSLRILYVEDDQALARLVQRHLERAGHVITLAYDGGAALAQYAAGTYDVLVVDFELPVLDGLGVIRHLRHEPNVPPILMVTASSDEVVALEALQSGVADYIIKDAQGHYLKLLPVVIRHVVERHRVEKALAQSERLMRTVLDTTPNPIFAKDEAGRYLLANEALAALFRTTADAMLGKTDADFVALGNITPQAAAQFRRDDSQVLQEQRILDIPEERVELPDGSVRWFQTRKSPLAADPAQRCLLGVAVDITQRKLIEQDLAQAQRLEAVGQLAAGIAHEINSPIQYIGDNTRFMQEAFQGFGTLVPALERVLEACKAGPVEEALVTEVEALVHQLDIAYYVEEIPRAVVQSLDGVQRVARIVRAIKEFAHPGSDEKLLIDLNRAVENTLTLARNEWKYVAEMTTDFAADLPLVPCRPNEIHQVVLNLVVNAAQAITEALRERPQQKGTIRVSTRQDGPWVEIAVSDSGIGIPQDIHTKIFNSFFTTKEIGQGTGQGLAIVHSLIVEKHGGTIDFETEVGRGTTFRIRLPLNGQPLAARPTTVPPALRTPF